MGVVLPEPPGLDINGVIYNYTINKDVNDHVDVYVQNENANGTGYIFREHDEWRPGSLGGTQINKAVPVIPNIPRSYWGNGSIDVQGNGSVSDPKVIYTYRVDPCFDPQFDPNCPGYQVPVPVIPEVDESYYTVDLTNLYDASQDENVEQEEACKEGDTDAKCKSKEDDEKESDKDDEKEETKEEKEERLKREKYEKAMAAKDKADSIAFFAQNNALFAQAIAQNIALQTMQTATNMNSYYGAKLPGGSYKESVVLKDSQLPENKRGLRNGLAQQLLHEEMVEMQYK